MKHGIPRPNDHRVTKKGANSDRQTGDLKGTARKSKPCKEIVDASAIRTALTTVLVRREPTEAGGFDRVVVLPEGVELVRQLAAQSYNMRSIASALGLGLGTLQRAMDRQDELRLALEAGRAEEERTLVENLRVMATKGNVVAAIFLLKARHGYREGDVLDQRPNVIINLPDAVTADTYLRHLHTAQQTPALPPPPSDRDER